MSRVKGPVELQTVEWSVRHHLTAGVAIAMIMIGGLASWSALASLAEAVIAPGTVVVKSNSKKIQHPYGGVVSEIAVADGDRVRAGQTLLRLDSKQLQAEIGAVDKRLHELRLRRWRLAAERDGRSTLGQVPADLRLLSETSHEGHDVVAVQRNLFLSRLEIYESQRSQLVSRVEQLAAEVDGLRELETGRRRELAILQEEISGLQALREKQLVPISRFNALRRDAAKLAGDLGRVKSEIARNRGLISATHLRLAELNETRRDEALQELEKIESEFAQLTEKRSGIADRLARVEIVAPVNGRIHELAVHTIGGVINSAETLLSIVPDDDQLVVDAHISPADIDRVRQGMEARIRFSAFNQRTTPELSGTVIMVSADQTVAADNATSYFRARIALAQDALSRLGTLEITPGMPAEVMITSGERTVLTYLTKPITDQFNRAFREE